MVEEKKRKSEASKNFGITCGSKLREIGDTVLVHKPAINMQHATSDPPTKTR
jgi:hypothetical protein